MNAPASLRPPARASRMTLAAVTRGVQAQPLRVVLYGPMKVGKTTFGAQAPSPIFIGPEVGTGSLDVARFPTPETWAEAIDAVRTLTTEEHDFKTLVVDSLDWLEPLNWRHVCEAERVNSIEKVGGGFHKGYTAALEEWRRFLTAVEKLRAAKRMHVVMLAHAVVSPFKNPEGDDYDRFTLKLYSGKQGNAAGLMAEWCDELLFANHRTLSAKVDPKAPRGRGYGSERVLYAERRAAFDAGSRHGVPAEMPLSWAEFYEATQRGQGEVTARLKGEIEAALSRLAELDASAAEKARAALANTQESSSALSVLLNRINAGVAQREAARTSASDDTQTNT